MSFIPIVFRRDQKDIETNNGMSVKNMVKIMSQWSLQKSILRVYDVKFKDGHPHQFRVVGFTDYNDRGKEEFLEFMFDVSLTHKIMFVDIGGHIFITKSDDGQTNIDADLIERMLNAYN
jgi:hypothetical protein